ncbi:unnamed protein product [Polarella glacialis]|uniref:Exo-alpha-sialidase n=1 Tax=Polarella glacialis TaxID=89957 RepID=A0A813JUF2_POLGL|nr:unnamed protein product [Polarella glacialis]
MSGWTNEGTCGMRPVRCIERADDGSLMGSFSTGKRIVFVTANTDGQGWTETGCVVSSEEQLEYADPNILHIPGTCSVFCAFRIQNRSPDPDFSWQVVVCRSDDSGKLWQFDSVVETSPPGGLFVGAPFLLLRSNGNLQIYYDSELDAAQLGCHGNQWLMMRERLNGIRGEWAPGRRVLDNGIISEIEAGFQPGLLRDGMASVVQLDEDNLLLVMEAVDVKLPHQNIIQGQRSPDGGQTWWPRFDVYRGRTASCGTNFNAYNPWVCRPGSGPAYVAFCTDEDFPEPPDPSNTPVEKRRAHVKLVRSLADFQSWSAADVLNNDGDKMYNPGLFELSPNKLCSTIDLLNGTRAMFEQSSE